MPERIFPAGAGGSIPLSIIDQVDLGIALLDQEGRVHYWNAFLAEHSGIAGREACGTLLSSLCPALNKAWFERQLRTAYTLRQPVHTHWENQPHLLPLKPRRPFTGGAELMYQNSELRPLIEPGVDLRYLLLIIHDVTELAVRTLADDQARTALERQSRLDGLTQLNNRGHWQERLERVFRRYRRNGQPASLVLFDIDHFKRFNDDHGHQAGDAVLQAVARVVSDSIRRTDIAGRYGGEEFAVILPDTGLDAAVQFAERLRIAVEALESSYEGKSLRVTISLGVAQLTAQTADPEAWVAQADAALYAAKRAGRNCVQTLSASRPKK